MDDLGAAYARAAAEHDPEAFATAPSDGEPSVEENDEADPSEVVVGDEAAEDVVTPEAIIEAALFVGHPQNKSLTEQRLASLMRGVSPEEVIQLIDQLNQSYREADQAFRIVHDDHGYRMTIAAEVENIRRSFLGKVREARLSQSAIEVLALVAYQPGVTAQKSCRPTRSRKRPAVEPAGPSPAAVDRTSQTRGRWPGNPTLLSHRAVPGAVRTRIAGRSAPRRRRAARGLAWSMIAVSPNRLAGVAGSNDCLAAERPPSRLTARAFVRLGNQLPHRPPREASAHTVAAGVEC